MTLQTLQELFEKIQQEQNMNNLLEHKFNLSMEVGKLHMSLHHEDHDRPSVLAMINAAKTLESIINERIQFVKDREIEERKQQRIQQAQEQKGNKAINRRTNIEESNLALACKKVLNRSTYKAILKVAQEMPHNKIQKLKEKDLPMLILDVKDEE